MSLSFQQYLDSKERLKKAIEKTPQQTIEYSVKKYCKLPVGESKDDKTFINLKPGHTIIVEWLYEDIDNPSPVSVKFEGIEDIDDEYDIYWSGKKLSQWLKTNSKQESFL